MTSRRPRLLWMSAGLLTLVTPTCAYAHTGLEPAAGFLPGLAHPVTGLDHLIAMFAVGLWAAQRGGRSVWLIPLTFVAVMILGGVLGMAAIPLPLVERGIVASVLVLGVLIAAAVRLPLVVGALVVGLFALLHGHAHGAEMPATAAAMYYGLGFIASTAALHLAGILTALAIQQRGSAQLVRVAGGAIALCGLYLFIR